MELVTNVALQHGTCSRTSIALSRLVLRHRVRAIWRSAAAAARLAGFIFVESQTSVTDARGWMDLEFVLMAFN